MNTFEKTTPFNPTRVEDAKLLQGRGQYLRDINLPQMQHIAIVRSAYAHGKLLSIDVGAAKSMQGVNAVLVARDFVDVTGMQLVMPPSNALVQPQRLHRCPLLASDTVTYLGQPIAVVVADTAANAKAAAEAVWAEIEAVNVVERDSTEKEAPMFRVAFEWGVKVDAKADAKADVIAQALTLVQIAHSQPRVTSMALETRGAVASFADGNLCVWLPTQSPARSRDDIAAMCNMPVAQVRVICPDVGGAFGAKGSVYPEEYLVALTAKKLEKNMAWSGSRSEEFLTAAHGRGARFNASLSISPDGKFQHLEANIQFPLGAWLPFSAGIPLRNTARILPGPYKVASLNIESLGFVTNAAPMNIYRGAGRPEAALLMERLVDRAAATLSIDPVELRRRNLIASTEMPFKTPTGELLDSGNYLKALDLACEKFGYEARRQLQAERRANGELIGIGVALYIEPCGQGWESARVTLNTNGTVLVASGSVAQGQGHETTYALIAAEALQCEPSKVSVVHGDTALCPDGIGSLASRSIAIGGSAILEACKAALVKKSLGEALPITAEVKYTAAGETWSYGCVISQVCVDNETGKLSIEKMLWVDDAGRIISPIQAHGQLIGGAAQGIGQALMERLFYDEQGQLTTGSLMDYAVPRASDMPAIELHSLETLSPSNTLGAKGVGETGCIGVPASLLNAASDALKDFPKAKNLHFPLTSENLWQAMKQ
jgi:aerobic carbon-monoxide dehydrogenase large subunit